MRKATQRTAFLVIGAVLLALAAGARASTVSITVTNSDGSDFNGPVWVYPVQTPILADGTFFIAGKTRRVELTNSLGSVPLLRGTYFLSNSVLAYCFAVPLDTGSYAAVDLKVSGYNLFEYVPGVTAETATNIAAAYLASNSYAAVAGSLTNGATGNNVTLSGIFAGDAAGLTNMNPATLTWPGSDEALDMNMTSMTNLDTIQVGEVIGGLFSGDGSAISNVPSATLASQATRATKLEDEINGSDVLTVEEGTNLVAGAGARFVGDGSGLTNLPDSGGISETTAKSLAAAATNAVPFSTKLSSRWRPPMHFNNWYLLDKSTNAMIGWARVLATNGYVAAGYDTMVFDSGWSAAGRDANDRLQADPTIYSIGMTNLVSTIHTSGVPHVGLYLVPYATIPSRSGYVGTDFAHAAIDAQTMADWGIDFIKFDDFDLSSNTLAVLRAFATEYQRVRPQGVIRLGIKSTETPTNSAWVLDWCNDYQAVADGLAADLGGDTHLFNVLQFLHSWDNAVYFNTNLASSGRYCAADALPYLGTDTNQLELVFSAAAVGSCALELKHAPSPADGSYWTTASPFILNREMIEINQDPGVPFLAIDTGHTGANAGAGTGGFADPHGYTAVAKWIRGGSVLAVALFNRDTNATATVSLSWTNLNLYTGTPCAVRDIWQNTNGWATNSLTYVLNTNGGALLKLYPQLASEPYVASASVFPDGLAYTNRSQTFFGSQTIQGGTLNVGVDSGSDTNLTTTTRIWDLRGLNYTIGSNAVQLVKYYSWAAGNSALYIGGDGTLDSSHPGPMYVYLNTASAANGAPQRRWFVDNSGVLQAFGAYELKGAKLTGTNGVINFGTGWTGTTNAAAPADAATVRAWVNYTNSSGGVFKMPLYQ